QLVDLAIRVGTGVSEGIKGIAPKKALKLVSDFGSIENLPAEMRDEAGGVAPDIRAIFLQPDVTDSYEIQFTRPDLDGIVRFLCDEREFSRERVAAALARTYK